MRRLLVMALLGVCALSAEAQTEVATPSEAQSLGCLVKPAEIPRFPTRDKLDLGFGAMRLLLTFSRPDAPPEVQVLLNTAREDMQDQVHAYVAKMRLPCLKPGDGTVSAVQDFNFYNGSRDLTPMPENPVSPGFSCLVMPRTGMNYTQGRRREEVQHVVARIAFTGDGQQAPEVTFIYSNGTSRYEQVVREWVSQFRMPCRTAEDKPRVIQQQFTMHPDDRRRYGFTRDRVGLMEFLAMTREPQKLQAYFDMNTMNCPFSVSYVVGGGPIANQASAGPKRDPNRVAFLRWIESLPLDFKTAEVANNLFGTGLQIDVPCGTLDLKGAPAPSGS